MPVFETPLAGWLKTPGGGFRGVTAFITDDNSESRSEPGLRAPRNAGTMRGPYLLGVRDGQWLPAVDTNSLLFSTCVGKTPLTAPNPLGHRKL